MNWSDYEEGFRAGIRTVQEASWTKETAAAYLCEVGPPIKGNDFDAGHQQAIKELTRLVPCNDLGFTTRMIDMVKKGVL